MLPDQASVGFLAISSIRVALIRAMAVEVGLDSVVDQTQAARTPAMTAMTAIRLDDLWEERHSTGATVKEHHSRPS